jgi:hypothetical protein
MRTTKNEAPTLTDGPGMQRLRGDLQTAFRAFPHECLLHLRENLDRLQPGTWHNHDGSKGCVFYLLSELLPDKITTLHDLAGHFPVDAAIHGTNGMAPRLVLRAFDGYSHHDGVDEAARSRYEGTVLDNALVKEELDAVLRSGDGAGPLPASLEKKPAWEFKLALG